MFRLFLAYCLSCLLLLACQPGGTQTETQTEAASGPFIPDPQPVAEQPVPTLAIGAEAPDFRLPGTDGEWYALADFAESKVLVIVFTCNHCPTAQAYEQRIKDVTRDYAARGVAVVAISPNSPLALLHEECGYSDLHDDYEDMQLRAEDMDFNFPYLYDGDDATVSMTYGPVATPHVFVFDADRKLQYTGRLDGSEKPGTAQADDLRAAIEAVLAGEPVAEPVTKTFGCSVKWAWKDDYKDKVNQQWRDRPVALETIDEAGIARLLANDSGKLRLINVWATWCGPCLLEYPDLLVTHRMYSGRDFEFISLSADRPEISEKVQQKLAELESGVTNYQFAKDDSYALIEALDPDWNGALPYTLLVAPGGEVVYRHQGLMDFFELRKTIVEHELIGRYY